VREPKSEPRTAHLRVQSKGKSLGATPPNRRQTRRSSTSRDAVQERKSGPRLTLNPPSRAEGKSLGATPSNRRHAAAAAVLGHDDARGRKSEPRAAHPRV